MWLCGRCWRIKPPGALTGYPSKPRGHLDRILRMGRPAGSIQDLNVQGQHAASPQPKRCAEPRRSQCLFQATMPHVPRTCGRRRVPNPTTVIPAKAGIHIPRTLKLLLLRQGLWIPAFAGMTKKCTTVMPDPSTGSGQACSGIHREVVAKPRSGSRPAPG